MHVNFGLEPLTICRLLYYQYCTLSDAVLFSQPEPGNCFYSTIKNNLPTFPLMCDIQYIDTVTCDTDTVHIVQCFEQYCKECCTEHRYNL